MFCTRTLRSTHLYCICFLFRKIAPTDAFVVHSRDVFGKLVIEVASRIVIEYFQISLLSLLRWRHSSQLGSLSLCCITVISSKKYGRECSECGVLREPPNSVKDRIAYVVHAALSQDCLAGPLFNANCTEEGPRNGN